MSDILDTRFEGKEVEISDNRVAAGINVNLTAKDPTLKKITVGVGWDMNAFEADALDLDVSLFMLGIDGKTRIDEDFIFYNNPAAFNDGVKHGGDSRTGAGDGDDETIAIDLQSIPFDIVKLSFVISIYRGDEKSQNLGMVRNAYIRLVNADTGFEILRYVLDQITAERPETALIAASVDREGPKWHFSADSELIEGGLRPVAERFGMIIADQ